MDVIYPPELISVLFIFFRGKQMQNSQQQPQNVGTLPNNQQQERINNNGTGVSPYSQKIQIVVSKRRPQVIQLDSSDDEAKGKVSNSVSGKPLKQPADKTKKIKKFSPKCKICNGQGKKIEMKSCLSCKNLFHLVCLNFEDSQIPKKFICQKCRYDREEQAQNKKKLKKSDVKQMELQKMMARKVQKEKRKEEQTRKMGEFLERYPCYLLEEGKVKFPIEDRLLLIYRDLFEINETNRLYPTEHPLIPSAMLGDLLQIENFFSTFNQELEEDQEIDARKSVLYFVLNSKGPDKSFRLMVGCLLRIYLRDVLERNKTDNVRTLNDNCFYTLLCNLKENQQLDADFISKVSVEIIRFLSTIPSIKKAFENFVYPVDDLNLETKINVLLTLIKGMSEVDEFHQLVSKRSDKIQEMTKERGDLLNKLKKDQAEVLSNRQKMRAIATAQEDRLQKKQIEDAETVNTKKDKEADKNKKKLQKLSSQKEKSEQVIKEFRSRISEISRSISFMTSQVLFLGLDRNKSEYFYFIREPHRLYVYFKEYLLSEERQYKIFDGKEKIVEFVKTLTSKGIQQKHLAENINSLIKEGIIHNLSVEDEFKDCSAELLMNERRNFREEVTVEGTVETILQIQATFSAYLLSKNLQWQSEQFRKQFTQNLKNTFQIHDLKEALRQMQQHFLFVENIQQDSKNNNQSNSEEPNNDDQPNQIYPGFFRKKVAIRIWGINSEKIKKYWVQYLQLCIDVAGLWICVYIFRNYVDKYVKRKIEHEQEVRKKNQKLEKQRERQRVKQKQRQREIQKFQRQRERQNMYRDRSRSRSRQRSTRNRLHPNRNMDFSSQNQEEQESHQNLRKSIRIRTKKLTLDSDYEEPTPHPDEQSENEECCEVCGQYGNVICCDTCPKVYHLDCVKIKEVPDGEWNCYNCLEKIANERQTRSRTKRRPSHN